jgi:hypothetical protein
MSLDLTQAFAQLADLTKDGRLATEAELRSLANQVSSFSSGSTTVLYSGKLADGTESSSVVKAMIDNGEDVRAIGKTTAAGFLNQLKGSASHSFWSSHATSPTH